MIIPYAPILALVLPTVSPVIIYPVGKKYGKFAEIGSIVVSVLTAIFVFSLIPDVVAGTTISYYPGYEFAPTLGISFGILVNAVSFPLMSIIALVSCFATIYSYRYMKDEPGHAGYYANLLLFFGGMMGVVLATNLIQFYIFWELMLVPSWLLIAFWGTPGQGPKIGFKYFIFTHVGALCMLLGIFMLFALTGTFDMVVLGSLIASASIPFDLMAAILFLFMIGFTVKMAAFPVHTWLPDAHGEAPTPISAMLSGIMIKLGAFALARIALTFMGDVVLSARTIISALAVVTMVWGGFMAIAQTDIKRLLAYSSVSQMGYILFGLSVYSELGLTGGLFHIVAHALGKGALFMCAGTLMHEVGTRDIREMGGLASKMPITAIVFLISALSLSGTPPLAGFTSEWMIFTGGLAQIATSPEMLWITAVALISTILTPAYYLWTVWRIFFGKPRENQDNVHEAPSSMWVPMILMAALTVIFGIFPHLLLNVISRAVADILGGVFL